jgi:hypothetical protein
MAGLVPAIHVFLAIGLEDVDARHKAGHDEYGSVMRAGRIAPAGGRQARSVTVPGLIDSESPIASPAPVR